jgi:hypothetical protein
MKRIRRNEFLLLEQDEGDSEEAKGGPYTPPKERILQYPDVADSMIETNASLDQIVDRYLLQYEKEAVPLNAEPQEQLPQRQPVAERKRRSHFFRFLYEQETPPADAEATAPDSGADIGGGDMSGGESTDSGGEPGEEAPTAPVPKINIRDFAEGIARLVNNYQTLLDPKSVILSRAMFYISKNYSPRLAKEMMGILERDFGLTPKTKSQQQAEIPAPPRQGNAGPDSGGGVPSGGGGD